MPIKLNTSQHHALLAKVANNILGCLRKSDTSRSREGNYSPLINAGRLNLESCVQFWASKYKKDVSILERVQCRATKMFY